MQERWLVRTAENQVIGPLERDAVIAQIQNRQLGRADEICPSGGYWFYLYEGDEVERMLGIRPPASVNDPHEEVTATGTRTVTDSVTRPLQSGHTASTARPFVLGQVEKTSIWKILVLGLVIFAGILVAWLLHILETAAF